MTASSSRAADDRLPIEALVVTDIFPPEVGGSGELLANIYSRLSGTPVSVLTTGGSPADGEFAGMSVVRDGAPTDDWGVLSPRGLFRHLRRLVRVVKMTRGTRTVLHCGRALPEGLAAYALRLATGRRYVCWVHGEEIAYARKSRELSALLSGVLRHADAILANSHNTAAELLAFGIPGRDVVVVHPGVDPERFRPDRAGNLRRNLAPDRAVVLLTVGRLQRRKGHDLVLEALGRLHDSGTPWRYVIVGDGPERARLERMADDLGVAERVRFVGSVGPDELSAYYAAADLFVHPNRIVGADFEGFGIVFLEAAAAGLPVIAGRSGGAPEAVEEHLTGLLVSGTSAEELSSAIGTLLADPEMRRRMGEAGRARVLSSFTWSRAAALVKAAHERVAPLALTGGR